MDEAVMDEVSTNAHAPTRMIMFKIFRAAQEWQRYCSSFSALLLQRQRCFAHSSTLRKCRALGCFFNLTVALTAHLQLTDQRSLPPFKAREIHAALRLFVHSISPEQ